MEAAASPRAPYYAASEALRLLDVLEDCWNDPKALINEIRYFDPVTQQYVEFKMFPPEGWESPIERLDDNLRFSAEGASDWFWQAVMVDWLHDPTLHKYLIYKARQLGITLVSCAYALWKMLFQPGSASVAFSYEEGEAKKLVEAAWAMFQGLPDMLKAHVEVITPLRRDIPSEWIRLRHKDNRISTFQAVPATGKHGHGSRVSFAIMDEVAKQDYSRQIYEAIVPATLSRGGKVVMISTADGVSNLETGEGNFFHHLYATRKEKGLHYVFLPWSAEPTRGEQWYQDVALSLPEVERNRQYPLNEHDGFMLSGLLYFDREALDWYRKNVEPPADSGQFVVKGRRNADFMFLRDGLIEVYEQPRGGGKYAIAVDTATGRGTDYTSADVIDLESGAICAHLHGKLEAPRAAIQLHYLGKWFNTALIAVERGGGYGDALIIALRDGNENLPAYPKMYRHKTFTRGNKPLSEEYGFPMTQKSRPQVLNELSSWLRQRLFPYMTAGHMDELGTFVYADTNPSPRAQEGCNDDRVMSLALAVEMYRQFGRHPDKRRTWKKRKYTPSPTRQEP